MTMSDDRIEARLREHLHTWADEAPHGADRLEEIVAARRPVIPRPWLTAAAAVVVLGIIAAVLVMRAGDEDTTVAGPGGVQSRIVVGANLGVRSAAAGDDEMWVVSAMDRRLFRVDPATDRVTDTYDIDAAAEGIAVDGDSIWLTSYEPSELLRVDAVTGQVTLRRPLAAQPWGPTVAFELGVVGRRRRAPARRSGEWRRRGGPDRSGGWLRDAGR